MNSPSYLSFMRKATRTMATSFWTGKNKRRREECSCIYFEAPASFLILHRSTYILEYLFIYTIDSYSLGSEWHFYFNNVCAHLTETDYHVTIIHFESHDCLDEGCFITNLIRSRNFLKIVCFRSMIITMVLMTVSINLSDCSP